MLRRPFRIRASSRIVAASIAATSTCVLAAFVATAAGETIEFTSTAPAPTTDPIAMGTPGSGDFAGVPLGTTAKKLSFRTNGADKRALAAAKTINGLDDERDSSIAASSTAQQRILAIEELLHDAQEDKDRLDATIKARLVEQYKGGEGGSISFLLAGGGAGGIIDRGKNLRDASQRDKRLATEYQFTVERLEQLNAVLADLRDIEGERSERLGERMDRLGQTLVNAKFAHDEAPLPVDEALPGAAEAEAKDIAKANNGTWYVMDGAFQSQLFLPSLGGGGGTGTYTGGTRTPRVPATGPIVQAVLTDPRIDFDASGIGDVSTMQIDGRLLMALKAAADRFGYIKITSLKSDHGVYTASGNVSAHSVGCAADIGTIGTTYITPGSQTTGGEVEQAVRFFAGLQGNLAPHQVISLFSLGGATLSMGDHGDHIHLGYSC